MKPLWRTSVVHAPTGASVEARIVPLTPRMIDALHVNWWNHPDVLRYFPSPPIDRDWDWHESEIELDGANLRSRKVALVAEAGYVDGAMLISTDPVPSALDAGNQALFVERVCTAPRNRRDTRHDGRDFLKGVGLALIRWAAVLSRQLGYDGRLRLDASPDFITWYSSKCRLQRLPLKPIVFEGVEYVPMELPPSGVQYLISMK